MKEIKKKGYFCDFLRFFAFFCYRFCVFKLCNQPKPQTYIYTTHIWQESKKKRSKTSKKRSYSRLPTARFEHGEKSKKKTVGTGYEPVPTGSGYTSGPNRFRVGTGS